VGWLVWVLVAIGLGVGEVLTPGLFFLGPVALAAVAAAVVSALGAGSVFSLLVFIVGSLASLAILSGATGRIAQVGSIFGGHHWVGISGPVVTLGLLLLAVRTAMTRTFDRPFAMGLAVYAVVTLVAGRLAVTSAWVDWAGIILKR